MQILYSADQMRKAHAFKLLHEREGIFVIPNAWDAGSAKMLETLGYEAIATTSAGFAFSIAKPDGDAMVTRGETIGNANAIVAATTLPVSADLENGFGAGPEACAATILLAAKAGLVGGSIEDATGKSDDPIYPFELSVERIAASVKAARSLPFPFVLTARAENLINGRPDLQDTILRLQAYADAGADVLYAPGLKTKEEVEMVVKAVSPKPINVLIGLGTTGLSLAALTDLGVKRVSVGSTFARIAYGAFFESAKSMISTGQLTLPVNTIPYASLNDIFRK